jgi:carbamoyltransferase
MILGISAYYHDSAAALVDGGRLLAAAQEERFTRLKHDPAFPAGAIRYCLAEAGATLGDVSAVAFYDKPLLKFERLLETYYGFAPKGVRSFVTAMPVWLREKLFLKNLLREELGKLGSFDARRTRLLFPEHHLSHAASAYYPSPFDEAAVLTVDGVGEWATASIAHGRGRDLELLRELRFPHSLGLLYSAVTYYLGFRVNSGEYKLMGLAPYGNAGSADYIRFAAALRSGPAHLYPDGSLWLDQRYFRYATGLTMTDDRRWRALFGLERRLPEQPIEQTHCDMALVVQHFCEEAVLAMAAEARRLTGSSNLCLAGGVALNCVANGRLRDSGLFEGIFVQPAAGDAGGAPGAALAAWHLHARGARDSAPRPDGMQGALLGPVFTDAEVEILRVRHGAVFRRFGDFGETCREAARLLADGHVLGWVQGRMEFGPRALGARSILADPRRTDMQRKVNLMVKFRESFRPFAPAVLEESADRYFAGAGSSPYMLFTCPVHENQRHPLPSDYLSWPLETKLAFERSTLPAVTHVDGSARVQTVGQDRHPQFWALLKAFEEQTGCPVLVNTSFNVRGEPIVCTPEDAYRCFMLSGIDDLIVGDYHFQKTDQPPWTGPQPALVED